MQLKKLWDNVSDNDQCVRSSDVKKFKRNYYDSVMCKFTPGSFKIDINFKLSNDLIFLIIYYLKYFLSFYSCINSSKFLPEKLRIDRTFLSFLKLIFKLFISLVF